MMLRWSYTQFMIKFTNLIWFFFQRGILSIIVYIEIKIVRFSTNRQTKGLENHQEGFQSCPLCINGITVDKKAASHIYNSTFSRDFSLVKFREAETYKSGCVLYGFCSNLSHFPFPILWQNFELSLVATLSYTGNCLALKTGSEAQEGRLTWASFRFRFGRIWAISGRRRDI